MQHHLAQIPPMNPVNWVWQLNAACRSASSDVFFLADNERGPTRRAHEAEAKAICASCPVRRRCLAWAVTVEEQHGIWGGATPAERDKIRIAAHQPAAA